MVTLAVPPGTVFGRLTVIEEAPRMGARGLRAMLCQCECGATTTVYLGHLRDGTTTSCGCARRDRVVPGTVFGRLTVVEEARTPGGRRAMLCRCECGTMAAVDLAKLRSGHTKSCGCLHREQAVDLARINTTNGMSKHAHRDRWVHMMGRCTNPEHPSFRRYGGRGITVFPEWHDIAVFCAWLDANLGPCLPGKSLDRIDNDGNYEPGNVRWATSSEQVRNSTLAKLTVDAAADIRTRRAAGETLKALAAEYGVSTGAIWFVDAGWTWREP